MLPHSLFRLEQRLNTPPIYTCVFLLSIRPVFFFFCEGRRPVGVSRLRREGGGHGDVGTAAEAEAGEEGRQEAAARRQRRFRIVEGGRALRYRERVHHPQEEEGAKSFETDKGRGGKRSEGVEGEAERSLDEGGETTEKCG